MSLPQGESLVDGLAVRVEGVGEPVVPAHAGVTDSTVRGPVVPSLHDADHLLALRVADALGALLVAHLARPAAAQRAR